MTLHRYPALWLIVLAIGTLIGLTLVGDVDTEHFFDPVMLTVITLAYLLSAGVILTRTPLKVWSVLGAGLFATMLGTALLYGYILYGRSDAEPLPSQWSALWLDVIRTCLFVGGPFVLIGLIFEWHVDRQRKAAG